MLKKKSILEAVNILRDLQKKHADSSNKKPLLEDGDQDLFLQISLKKIPPMNSKKHVKVLLPHSLIRRSDEVCLIMGDLDKRNHRAAIEPDVLHYKQLLKEHGVDCISEVITLRQLRTDYKPFEARRKLQAAYALFLTDKKIAECLPRTLGKFFFKKRKYPTQVNMKTSNIKEAILKALHKKIIHIRNRGNSCASEVAYLDMPDKEIFQNIRAMVKTLASDLPGSFENIMGLYLRTRHSRSIPLYMSYDDSSKVQIKVEKKDRPVIGELSTQLNSEVKVCSSGRIKILYKKKGGENDNDIETVDQGNLKEIEEENSNHAEESSIVGKRRKKKVEDCSPGKNLEQGNSGDIVGREISPKKLRKMLLKATTILSEESVGASSKESRIRNLEQGNSEDVVGKEIASQKSKKRPLKTTGLSEESVGSSFKKGKKGSDCSLGKKKRREAKQKMDI